MFKKIMFLGQTLKGFATVKGANRTKMDNSVGENIVEPGQDGSNLKVQADSYTFAGEASGTVLRVGNSLPAGARIHAIIINSAALGSGVTLDVGDSHTATRYDTAIACTSAAQTIADNIGGKNYKIGTNTGDNQILLTTGGAAATGAVKALILYAHA